MAEHLKQAIHFENRAALLFIFDTERPIRATDDMLPWYTGKVCEHVNHSHINMAVLDSRWEAAKPLSLIAASSWLLGSRTIAIRRLRPDYLVRLANRKMLVTGTEGTDNQEQ
jgi:type III restriction enzyme